MRTFTIARRPSVFEVCVFRDGRVAARVHGPDPLLDHTENFESVSEAEAELDFRFPPPEPAHVEPAADITEAVLRSIASGELPEHRQLPAYAFDGHPLVRKIQEHEP